MWTFYNILYWTKMPQRHSIQRVTVSRNYHFYNYTVVGKYEVIVGNMKTVSFSFISFLSLFIHQHFGPWENKTLLRFAAAYKRKYGLLKSLKDFDLLASPSMNSNHLTYFCRQSASNLISNKIFEIRIIILLYQLTSSVHYHQ